MKRHSRIRALIVSAGILALLIAGSRELRAQRFQTLFGGGTYSDRGAGGAQLAANGDYITAATTWSPSGGGSSDIYVVRANGNGVRVWDRTYDISSGADDFAGDIHACANGDFVITGGTATGAGGVLDLFVMRISSTGALLWCRRYGISMNNEIGYDITEAATGNGSTTHAGDLLVAGLSYGGLLTGDDGFLLRIPSGGGAAIWSRTYDLSNTHNYLYGIDEAVVGVPVGSAGDVVAAGVAVTNSGFGDVWILRVDGNTGTIGAAPQGSAQYGDALGHEEGRRIIELRSSTRAGDLVITGRTDNVGTGGEILMLETQANPCTIRAAMRMGDGGTPLDEGMGLCEIRTTAYGLARMGNILATGRTELGTFGSSDVFLQELAPGSLALVTAGPEIFGGDSRDIGVSVGEAPNSAGTATPGFYIVGTCGSPSIITPFDREQIYTIKTDAGGQSCADVAATFVTATIGWTVTSCAAPTSAPLATTTSWTASVGTQSWGTQICYLAKPVFHEPESAPSLALCGDGAGAISRPSPLKRGGVLQLRCAPSEPRAARVSISDAAGRIVFDGAHDFSAGEAPMAIDTRGWPAGIYLVTIASGPSVERASVVIVE